MPYSVGEKRIILCQIMPYSVGEKRIILGRIIPYSVGEKRIILGIQSERDYSESRRDETDILTAISGPSCSTTPVSPACRPHCSSTPLSEVSRVFPRSTDRFW